MSEHYQYYYFLVSGAEWIRQSIAGAYGRILPDNHYLMDHRNIFNEGKRVKNIMIFDFLGAMCKCARPLCGFATRYGTTSR
jgi:hypothetical protein